MEMEEGPLTEKEKEELRRKDAIKFTDDKSFWNFMSGLSVGTYIRFTNEPIKLTGNIDWGPW